MKKIFRYSFTVLLIFALTFCVGCKKADRNYGVSAVSDSASAPNVPIIRSSDEIMPLYFDISLFNEENYSDVTLGDKIPLEMIYAGETLAVPSDLATLAAHGFTPQSDGEMIETVKAGERLTMTFVNPNGIQLKALFYNPLSTSVALRKCKVVELKIEQNYVLTGNKTFGDFLLNGTHNRSAITDVAGHFGTPSHFHDEHNGLYSIDYYVSNEDHRNKITLWIDTDEDAVHAVMLADYR